jgi:hypothetical protein
LADLKPGKYRIDFSVDNEATSACKGSASTPFEVKLGIGAISGPSQKITSVSADKPAVAFNKPLTFYVLGEKAGKCDKLTVSMDDKKLDLLNVNLS